MRSSRLAYIAAVISVIVGCPLIGGCGSGGGQQGLATPSGFARASTKVVSVAHPESWRRLPDSVYPTGWKLEYGVGPTGAWDANMAVKTNASSAPSAKMALLRAQSMQVFSGVNYQRKASHAVDVAGAKSAWRMDYAYKPPGAPDGIKGLVTEVAVVTENGEVARVRLNYYTNTLKQDVLQQIVKSIAVV